MHKAIDIMSRDVLRVTTEQTVVMAASLMQERGVSGIAVEEGGKLVGILTQGDIAIQAFVISRDTPIRDVMDDTVACCHGDDDAGEVVRHMLALGVRRLPVVDRQDHVLGIVTLGAALSGRH